MQGNWVHSIRRSKYIQGHNAGISAKAQVLMLHFMTCHSRSAIGPAPQAVTKTGRGYKMWAVFGMHDNICLNMRSSEVQQLGQKHLKPPLPQCSGVTTLLSFIQSDKLLQGHAKKGKNRRWPCMHLSGTFLFWLT